MPGGKKGGKIWKGGFSPKAGKTPPEPQGAWEADPVLRLGKNDVVAHLDTYVTAHGQQIITALGTWWDKYAVPLHQIETERDTAASNLMRFLKELGYE